MKTSQGIVTASIAVAGTVAVVVGIAPLATADDEAGAPGTATGASAYIAEADSQENAEGSPIVQEALQDAALPEEAEGHEVVAPAAVNSTSVGKTNAQVSDNRIDTSSKKAVREAFAKQYLGNNVQIQPSAGADIHSCTPGEVNSQAADMVIGAWNFFRGMNNLDAVSIDPASPLSRYMQKAALTQAAEATLGSHRSLSHHPLSHGYKCADKEANAGASRANLAQANAFTASEQVQWWFQDWSGYKKSTMTKDGINDQLGHRNWLMDPYVRETAYGNVAGYNSLAVATGGSYDDYEGSRMKNPNATTPETMAWPSAGYFPAELLTSISADDPEGSDVERWSFHVNGADMSSARVSVTGPQGEIPVRVVNSGSYAPKKVSGYSAVLFKMSNKHVHAPQGTQVDTYTVRVSGVKGTGQTNYYYQVKLFNATATEEAPTLAVAREPIAIEGATSIPARINATGANNKYQWQISADQGRTWKDAPQHSQMKVNHIAGQSNTLKWSPTLQLCESHGSYYPCPLNAKDVDQYRFRLRASNKWGTAYTPAIKAHYVHFVDAPERINKGDKLNVRLNTQGNGDYLGVSQDVHYYADGRYQGKNGVNTNINAKNITAKVTVTVWEYSSRINFQATKTIAIR